VIRVTADTNILVSGLSFPDGNPHKILNRARAGEFTLAVSDAILEELADVLTQEFDWPERDIVEARRQFGLFAKLVTTDEVVNAIASDPDDNAVLECALAARSQFVVSGDRHLLQMGTFRGIPILKAADFLERLAQEGDRNP
jgi:putative PIN family toxin of toxin-antitoxin system